MFYDVAILFMDVQMKDTKRSQSQFKTSHSKGCTQTHKSFADAFIAQVEIPDGSGYLHWQKCAFCLIRARKDHTKLSM